MIRAARYDSAPWAPIEALRREQKALDKEEEELDTRIDAIDDRKVTTVRASWNSLAATQSSAGRRGTRRARSRTASDGRYGDSHRPRLNL